MEDYEIAADILGKLRAKKGSIKGLCLAPRVKNKKKVYALVCETLKMYPILTNLLDRTDFSAREPRVARDLAAVLTHDLLFAKRGILCGGWMKSTMTRHRTVLRAALLALARERRVEGLPSDPDNAPGAVARAVLKHLDSGNQDVPLPRYVRVNTLRTTVAKAVKEFQRTKIVRKGVETQTVWKYGGAIDDWKSMAPDTFYQDLHLPELLVFPPSTDFHLDTQYKSGSIVLQDKASCFPAFILAPPTGAHCIDGCAAPGNKTSHLCAKLRNQGYITAFDLDARRLETLKKMTTRAGCRVIDAVHGSFLETDPARFPQVTHILLDPSCSGSGIVARLDALVDTQLAENLDEATAAANDPDRLVKLAEFQQQCVMHAMKFPSVQFVSYSTCSIHAQENEQVVAAILAAQNDFELAPRDRVLPTWPHRGDEGHGLSAEDANKVVRAAPDDGTNGFFVALFVRKGIDVDVPPTAVKEGKPKNRAERRAMAAWRVEPVGSVGDAMEVDDEEVDVERELMRVPSVSKAPAKQSHVPTAGSSAPAAPAVGGIAGASRKKKIKRKHKHLPIVTKKTV
ncbi:hypothetical protein AMAG_15483 [Allomyces macrogynus ATCC 38327]|uniref:SAM-dependent MTase RsmB/NOP-type domain-containing protein n=1 Tax=Allomyces macrogynus (strain ATCC 38327) TaxID=578462 RepID=A0A0L0T7K8_ALLM3|nr:hypothetical protein AMAG_15483 [Allomyces macrogynus ATCC 38327]|eukprot:KNE70732.1 hypothetical protein AMAG_15483 [Allomyces macrogynus ATCC 38327]